MMPPQMSPMQQMGHGAFATIDQGLDGKQPQAAVNYRPAEDPSHACATCSKFQPMDQCSVVAGKIDPAATCDVWGSDEEPPEEEMQQG